MHTFVHMNSSFFFNTNRFVLNGANGIENGFQKWGDIMLTFNGKKRIDNRYKDTTHGTIGYWTDNGGYYHYSTGINSSKTYEEILPEVKQYHDDLGVRELYLFWLSTTYLNIIINLTSINLYRCFFFYTFFFFFCFPKGTLWSLAI